MRKLPEQNEKLLKEIRENFTYACDAWRDIRDEAKRDMAFISGDPWDPEERSRRQDPKSPRPCLVLDELSQYTNQTVNEIREQKRAIKVDPIGAGANEKTAELRGNIIRQIEYDSNAQAAYITAVQNAMERSYGAFRINTAYVSAHSHNQKVTIERIANPDTVYPDPDFRQADGSDVAWTYVVDFMPKAKYKREFSNSQISSFAPETLATSPRWISDKSIQVAEYWKLDKEEFELALMADGTSLDVAEVESGKNIIRTRKSQRHKVTQYITNGFEILEVNEWRGKYIPIIMVFGRELWVDKGSGSERMLMSQIRLARDPQQLVNYYASTEAEVIRMVPKAPFLGITGQFENKEKVWQAVNDTPVAYLEYNATTEATQQAILPPPSRPQYDPPVQAMEIGKESSRRSVQSAMGISPLPTAAQRQNEKSGVAIQRIKDSTQIGSFHFVDNFERSLRHAGKVIDDLLPHIYDSPRDVGIRKANQEHEVIRINEPVQQEDGSVITHELGDGDHEVTISTGPSFDSERDQANSFADGILQALPTLPIPDTAKAQLLAMTIKLKDIGPIGDEMADIIAPKQDGMAPQAQAAVSQLQGQLKMAEAAIQQLTAEKAGKMAEIQGKLQQSQMDNETKIAIAEINTKAQSTSERVQWLMDAWQEMHGAAHDAAMQSQDHAHEQALAQQSQQAVAQQQASAQAAEQQSQAQQEPEPQGG